MNVRLPTRRRDWRLMARTARLVLSVPAYAALAAVATVAALTVFVVSQNLELAQFALVGPLPIENRVEILLGLYPFVGTSFPLEAELLLVAIAALAGVDLAMVAYHFREHGVTVREGGGGTLGLLFGTLGAGCAACGSVLLAGLLSLVGAAGAATLLPLDGLEFSLLALAALVLSVYWVADGMRGGEVNGCPVDVQT